MLRIWAPAKLNLTLEVLGRRGDGYHEIRSVVAKLALADLVYVETGLGGLDVRCDHPGVPSGPGNLAYSAALKYFEQLGCGPGARIVISKKIPVAAGLGGGSSDAAAVLRALNAAYGNPLTMDRLQDIAAQVGSDVPLFLAGPLVLVEGRGERLSDLPGATRRNVLLIHPGGWLSTGVVYRRSDGLPLINPCSQAVAAAMARKDERAVRQNLGNALEAAACDCHPAIGRLLASLRRAGYTAHLTGSGPCCYVWDADPSVVRHVSEMARVHGWCVLVTHTLE